MKLAIKKKQKLQSPYHDNPKTYFFPSNRLRDDRADPVAL